MEAYALTFLRFIFFSYIVVHGAQDQRNTMLELAKEVPSLKWNTSNTNPCKWKRVTCSLSSSTTQVTRLILSDLGLSNSNSPRFFEHLCQISSLLVLDLSSNSFTYIPSSFFYCKDLSNLKYLNLSFNSLAGPLRDFFRLSNLETLDLSFNSLEGAVVSQLNQLVQLKNLNLSSNLFNGTVPFFKTKNLEELTLSDNDFHGQIPSEYFTYENLTFLDLSRNSLNGQIPSQIGSLSKLETLLLSSNKLNGAIPTGLSKLKNLSKFAANLNLFSGTIPPGITSHMYFFDLSYNKLQGQIPGDLLAPETLQTVVLTANLLLGTIPRNLSKKLYRLMLGENSLTGSIPAEVGELLDLTYLELNDNYLGGEIPQNLGNCKNLTMVYLANNQLQGGLPVLLGELNLLVVMELQRNKLSGRIPAEFSNLANLITLNLSHNSLDGSIPSEFSKLSKLQILNLGDNMLAGSVPDSLSGLPSIIELQLGNNKLSGIIPNMPTSLSSALNLSNNLFNGAIPSQLGSLSHLEILDLSNNNFSGDVPNSFVGLQSLTELLLSNNHNLSGSLPLLNPKTIVDFNGTRILSDLASHLIASHGKRKSNTNLVVIIVIVGIFSGFVLIAAFAGLLDWKRFYKDDTQVLESKDSHIPQIRNCHLITSDAVHKASIDFIKAIQVIGNDSNIFLKTGHSTYYMATMPHGNTYTIKKLNWSDKSFPKCSNETFGQEVEAIGRLSNSNIMVPLAYMLTEDSAHLFYENIHKGTVLDFLHNPENCLDWPSRYNIALGVAQGLAFLHNCSQPILLLDLSTNIIFLKSTKEPQIGDVELCKVIDPSKSTGSFSIFAGSVGYIPPGKLAVSEGIELAQWALSYSIPNEKDEILDRKISSSSPAVCSQMVSVLKIALSCVNSSPEARPKMRKVLRMLFNAR